jgi:hypothetical protein
VEECVVCGVEGLETIRGGEITLKLVGGAVDGRCELGEVEYIQGAIKPQLALAERPSTRVQLLDNIKDAAAESQPLIHIDECYPQHFLVAVHRQHAAFDVSEEFFSAHGEPSDK